MKITGEKERDTEKTTRDFEHGSTLGPVFNFYDSIFHPLLPLGPPRTLNG